MLNKIRDLDGYFFFFGAVNWAVISESHASRGLGRIANPQRAVRLRHAPPLNQRLRMESVHPKSVEIPQKHPKIPHNGD